MMLKSQQPTATTSCCLTELKVNVVGQGQAALASKTLRALLVQDSLQDVEMILSSSERHSFVVSNCRVCNAATMTTALAGGIWDVLPPAGFQRADALEIYRQEELDIPFVCVSGKIGEEEAAGMILAPGT